MIIQANDFQIMKQTKQYFPNFLNEYFSSFFLILNNLTSKNNEHGTSYICI